MQVLSIAVARTLLSHDTFSAILQALVGEIKKPNETIVEFVNGEKNRRKLLRFAWLLIVLLALLLSVIALFVSKWLAGGLKPGIVFVVFLWAALFGGTALLSLRSKVLTTLFGGLIGVSLSEVSTGFSGLLEKATKGIAAFAVHIGTIVGPASGSYSDFIGWMVWLFIGVVALFCLPAFFAD